MTSGWDLLATVLAGLLTGGLTLGLVLATFLRRLGREEAKGTRVMVYIVVGWVWFLSMVFLLMVEPWLRRSG
jgi:hypothetical protein